MLLLEPKVAPKEWFFKEFDGNVISVGLGDLAHKVAHKP